MTSTSQLRLTQYTVDKSRRTGLHFASLVHALRWLLAGSASSAMAQLVRMEPADCPERATNGMSNLCRLQTSCPDCRQHAHCSRSNIIEKA